MDQTTATATSPQTAAPANLSLAEALDAALGSNTVFPADGIPKSPSAAPAVKVEAPAPTEKEQPKVEKVEPKADKPSIEKTPDTVLDRLGKLGAPQEEKKVETSENKEVLEEAKESSPAAQTAFAKLTKELRDTKARLKEVESKSQQRTDEVEADGQDADSDDQVKEYQAKIQEFEKERETLENELRISRVESTKEFKQSVAEPITKTVAEITDTLAPYEVKPANILDAASEVDASKRRQRVKELTAELDPVDALLVRTKVEELAKLNLKKDEMIKDSKTVLEQIQKREKEAEELQKASYDSEAKKAFGEVWDQFQTQMPLLQKIDGNETWNNTIDSLRVEAERLDNEPLDHRSRASLTYQAVALPLVVQIFKEYISKANKEVSELRTTLGEYRKGTPGVASGQTTTANTSKDQNVSFLDALEKGL
jgi:chromosome segregation ATPase